MKFLAQICLLAACVAMSAARGEAPPSAAAEPANETGAPLATGTVIFFRPWKFTSMGKDFYILENGKRLALLENGTFFTVQATEGVHNYITRQLDLVTIEVESGETYYIVGSTAARTNGWRGNLAPAKKADYEKVRKSLKPAKTE